MASTTARIAVKLAKSPLQTPVATEPKSLHMHMDADARLAAAAGGVARFLADAAGLENSAVIQLQSTVVAACTEAFEHLSRSHRHLEINFARYADRIEVALTHEGCCSPAAGPHTVAGFAQNAAGSTPGLGAFAGVDSVQCETHGGEIVTRLTKYLGNADPDRCGGFS
jgi:hypothetical protein